MKRISFFVIIFIINVIATSKNQYCLSVDNTITYNHDFMGYQSIFEVPDKSIKLYYYLQGYAKHFPITAFVLQPKSYHSAYN